MAPTALRRPPRGVALPMAILAVALLTSLIAGALLMLGNERRTSDTQDAATNAATLAQSALRWFMNERSTTFGFVASPPAASESTRITYSGLGYADVVLTRIRPVVGTAAAVYLVRAHGVLTGGTLSGLPAGERTVAEYAQFQKGSMAVQAGWTSLTGLKKSGGTGTLSGTDACGVGTAVAGVAVPASPGYQQTSGTSVPTGSPAILNLGTQALANASVHIDWDGILNHNALTPTVTIPPGTFPSSFPASYWPVILVKQAGAFAVPSGQGTLIVQNDATVGGTTTWNGVILVGGKLTSNGNNTILGAVVSGLNMVLGQTVVQSDAGSGTKTFRYNSCNVASAMAGFATLKAIENAWADNWAGY